MRPGAARGVLAAVCVVVLPAGCSTVAPVAGPAMLTTGFTYTAGKASQDFPFPNDKVQAAVLGAMEDLRIHSIVQRIEPGAVHYEGSTADSRRAMVTIRPFGGGGTRLSARMGWFGDEPLSRALMDRTGIRLGTLPPAPIPDQVPSKPDQPLSRLDGEDRDKLLRDQAEARFYDNSRP